MKIKECLEIGKDCGMVNVLIYTVLDYSITLTELNEMYEGLRTLLEDNILTEQALEFLNEK